MKIKRISFIEAASPGLHIFSRYPIPRLGAVLLSTILRDRGYEVKAFIEDIAEPDWEFVENSDLVCISTITSTALKAYSIGKRLKALGLPIIMGGVHPTFLPEEALEYADYVLRGEGDHSLLELLAYLEKGAPALSDIKGLSYKDKNASAMHTPDRAFIQDLDGLPHPDFSLVHTWDPSRAYPISTSRGCPYGCSFCSVISMFGRKCRYKSVDATMREVRYANAASPAAKFFVDDNFAANKSRARAILSSIIDERIKMQWAAQVRTDVAGDAKLLRLMADSGCHTLHIGFESINPATLKAFRKEQTRENIITCIKTVKEHGIHIHGMFVLGADTDDVETIHHTAEFVKELDIDTVQFLILTPLPGTQLFQDMQEQGRLLHTDWSKYDVQHVVFRPQRMSPATLQLEPLKAMGRFYSWKYIFRHIVKLNFYYAAIGAFGKQAVKKALKTFSHYLHELGLVAE